MENLLSTFAAQFKAASLSSLVDSFNSQVGNYGWTSARAAYNKALMAEIIARGVDVSAIHDGLFTLFKHHVILDESSNKLVIVE